MKISNFLILSILSVLTSAATTDGIVIDNEVVWSVTNFTADEATSGLAKRCTSCVGDGGPCIPGKGQCHNPKGCWSKDGGPFVCQCAQGGEYNFAC